MTNLVLIQNNVYSFFENRELIIKVAATDSIDRKELEQYRSAPRMLREELTNGFNVPRIYVKNTTPEYVLVIYFDGTENSIKAAKQLGFNDIDSLADKECYIIKKTENQFEIIESEDEFHKLYTEH